MSDKSLLFATREYAALGRAIAAQGFFEQGEVTVENWPDGEIYQKVLSTVAGRNVVLVAGTDSERNTLEAFDLACAVIEQGALRLRIAVPFFGYATMERASQPGEAVTAKSRARIWASLPSAPMGNRIFLLEPHDPSLPYFFSDAISVAALGGAPLMMKMLKRFSDEPVLCSPDVGRIKWVDALAKRMNRPSAFVLKRRTENGSVESFGLSGSVMGRSVMICDDMVRTGGTLLNAARVCLDAGAMEIGAAAIHGAFTPGSLDKLRASGLIKTLICTDSHPKSRERLPDWVGIESCAGIFAEALAPTI